MSAGSTSTSMSRATASLDLSVDYLYFTLSATRDWVIMQAGRHACTMQYDGAQCIAPSTQMSSSQQTVHGDPPLLVA